MYFLLGGVGLQLSNAAPLVCGSYTWVLQDTSYPCLYKGLMGIKRSESVPFPWFEILFSLYFVFLEEKIAQTSIEFTM